MRLALMSPRGTRTPLDYWWLAVLVTLTATLVLDWSSTTSLVASVASAAVLLAGHVVVVRRRSASGRRDGA